MRSLLTAGILLWSFVAIGAELSFDVLDGANGKPVAARVLVRDSSGATYRAEGAVEVPIGKEKWFVTAGTVRLSVPPGAYELRVERGTEYRPVRRMVDAGGRAERIVLERWIDMKRLGYR
ncbi:MAG: hypothetical protein NTY38_29465, partial [Acidobacteria bacterium]|nr:hypothetical protein [Acidobacteriota bacterium]